MSSENRGTIFLEEARVLDQKAFDGDQYVIRVAAPKCAARAEPGSFAHISVDAAIPMRRPLSIMRADAKAGWIEMLYKVVGSGLHALAARKAGDSLSVLGPIGKGFTLHPDKPRTLLIGGGVGIPPMVFLSDRLREDKRAFDEFTSGHFEFGAGVSAVAITAAASGDVGTTGASASASGGKKDAKTAGEYHKGIAVFVISKGGALVDASVAGQKYSYKPRAANKD